MPKKYDGQKKKSMHVPIRLPKQVIVDTVITFSILLVTYFRYRFGKNGADESSISYTYTLPRAHAKLTFKSVKPCTCKIRVYIQYSRIRVL